MSTAVILAGGQGTRLHPYTMVLPKPLVPVGDLPVLEIIIRQLKFHKINRILLCVGYLAPLIEGYFGNGEKFGIRIEYYHEDKPLGTAGPIAQIEPLLEDFFVINGDLLTTLNFSEMLQFHKQHNFVSTIGAVKKSVKIELGVLEANSKGCLMDYKEKPQLQYLASMGVYVFSPEIFSVLQPGVHLDLPQLMTQLSQNGSQVMVYSADCEWLDIGRHDDLKLATETFINYRSKFLPE